MKRKRQIDQYLTIEGHVRPSQIRVAWDWFIEGWRTDETWMGYLFRGGVYMLVIVILSGWLYPKCVGAQEPTPTVDWSNPDSVVAFAALTGSKWVQDPDDGLEKLCASEERRHGATPQSIGALGWWWDLKINEGVYLCISDAPIPAELGRGMCARINLQFHKVEGPRVYCRDGEGA